MSELVAALLGIVAGGLLTGAVDLYVAARERRTTARAAARLIYADRVQALNILGVALDADAWWTDPLDDMLRADHWTTYRDRLAGGIPAHDFTTIDGAFFQVVTLQNVRLNGVEFGNVRTGVEEARAAMEDAGDRIIKASHGRRGARREIRDLVAMQDDADRDDH